jgi:ubiquitin-like domain-containing CTD phosphatase 1
MIILLKIKWNGSVYDLEVEDSIQIVDLKSKLFELTNVMPVRQKLIGFVKGKLPTDDTKLLELKLNNNHQFMLMGTSERRILKEEKIEQSTIEHRVDVDLEIPPHLDPVNINSLEKTLLKFSKIQYINPPRQGKRLLVLDLDYTLFDCKTTVTHISQLARPGLHDMLAVLYNHYDLCIWSQTSWKWLEAKITELGMLTHDEYSISFVLDQTAMFSIQTPERKHQVKPLELIWRLTDHDATTTIHVDDLGRNFKMNPQSVS